MIQKVEIEARRCTCDLCGHEWISTIDGKLPTMCPTCRSREWNGKKRTGRPPGPVTHLAPEVFLDNGNLAAQFVHTRVPRDGQTLLDGGTTTTPAPPSAPEPADSDK